MYTALEVADYILWKYNNEGKTISNLKLQKVLYFIQTQFMVNKGEPCFSDDILAWDIGPVIPNVYHNYKVFGAALIPYKGKNIDLSFGDRKLIDDIIDRTYQYTASQLVEITHNQAPWKSAYKSSSKRISLKSLQKYFSE